MANILTNDFGDSESEDDNFNPGLEVASDEEEKPYVRNGGGSEDEGRDKSRDRQRNGGEQGRRVVRDDEDDEDGSVRGTAQNEEESGDERGGEEEGEEGGGEDEEGEGEDLGNGDEDDEEEDEEDDDEEEEISQRPRKRARRGDQRNAFLDIEAEVERDEEAEEEDEDGPADGFIADMHPDDLDVLPPGAERDDRRHRELDRQREMEASIDAEKQAQLLKERYGRNRGAATTDSMVVPKTLLLPSVDDPSIWGVKCKPGKEKEVIFGIMKRMDERAMSRNPMPIISTFQRVGTSTGYIYVEARKQSDILVALDGLSSVYPRSAVTLIPIKEMPDLLRMKKSEPLKLGGYVRIKRGKYSGDLAQIEEVEPNGLEVTLKVVPRLDYGVNENDPTAPRLDPKDAKRKRAAAAKNAILNRPPPRLFSEVEAKKFHSRYVTPESSLSKKAFRYLGEQFVDGYLMKDFKVQHLQTEGVNPSLSEVTQFIKGGADGTDELDLAALAKTLKNSVSADSYLPGDIVEVYEGEQKGVFGKTVTVRGDIITLKVEEGELKGQTIDAPVKTLRKRFREGDHVKVIGGSRFRDEVGMVVRIKDERVTLVTDLNQQEVTVFSKDLREASDTSTSQGLGTYDVHDLIQLDPATVACVVKVDHESMRVLDQNGTMRTILPSQVSNRIEPRKHAVATDRSGSEVRLGDTVKDLYGENQKGLILHIYRSFLFLHDREQLENAGVFVARSTNVLTVAAKGGRATANAGPDLTKMNPALQRNGMNGNGAMPPPKSMGRDRLLGQTVSIRRGPHKGLMGIVKDTTDTQARVELHTKAKIVTVDKEILGMKDPITGANMDMSRFVSRPRGGFAGSGSRANYGGATPTGNRSEWGGSRIPNAGSATPAASRPWERTPAHAPTATSTQSSRIPNRGDRTEYNSGSSTAYGGWGSTNTGGNTSYGGPTTTSTSTFSSSHPPGPGAGAGTGAGYGGATQYGGGYGGATQYGGSGNYHSFDSGSRTPSARPWQSSTSNTNATSSKPWDAPTPGGPSLYHSAPTPNVSSYSAPTPGNSGPVNAPTPHSYGVDAPTPGATGRKGPYDAPTPAGGAYGAPTPAFSGGTAETPRPYGDEDAMGMDDGPRYDEGTPSP